MYVRKVLTIIALAISLPLLAQQAAPKPKPEETKVSVPAPKPPEVNTSALWRLALQIQNLQSQMKDAQADMQKEQEKVSGVCIGAGFQLGQLPQAPNSSIPAEIGCVAKQEATTAPPPSAKGK